MNIVVLYLIPIFLLGVSFFLWFYCGKIQEINLNIKQDSINYNSLDFCFYKDGKCKLEAVVSLLLYLANKGYLKINYRKNSKKIELIKAKDYDGNDENEKLFFDCLFSSAEYSFPVFVGNEVVNNPKITFHKKKDTVHIDTLYGSFFKAVGIIKNRTNKKKNKLKIFSKSYFVVKNLLLFILIVSVFYMMFLPNCFYDVGISTVIGILFLINLLVLFIYLPYYKKKDFIFNNKKILGIIDTIFLVFSIVLCCAESVKPFLLISEIILTFFSLLCSLGILWLFVNFKRRNDYGLSVYEEVSSFFEYFKSLNREQLIMNPSCFYEILPYAYASDYLYEWLDKFENIEIPNNEWLPEFSYTDFNEFKNYFTNLMIKVYIDFTGNNN